MVSFTPAARHAGGEVADPVSGMAITPPPRTPTATAPRHRFYFCSAHCATAFDADPDQYFVSPARHTN